MHSIVYTIDPTELDSELAWLKEQKVFPAVRNDWDWFKNKPILRFGVIVGSEAALAIKLRHKLDLQKDYRK